MKKIVFLILLFAAVAVITYVIIPSQLIVSDSITAPVNTDGVFRNLAEENNWKKWWPGTLSTNGDSLLLSAGDVQFKVSKILYNALEVDIQKGEKKDSSTLQFFSTSNDSLKIVWVVKMAAGNDPFGRVRSYFQAHALKAKMDTILTAMKNYISSTKNIYGLDIKLEKKSLQYIVSAKKTFPGQPATREVYEMINSIKQYISSVKGNEESFPMLHVLPLDSGRFETQVGIPVKQQLPGNSIFSIQATPEHAKFLVAEVTGGKNTIDQSIIVFNKYLIDYHKIVMASPYQLLVTDRSITDTAKWVTRFYYPIM